MSSHAESPTACLINQIQGQGYNRANDKNAGEQYKCYNHFLNKIDLQGDECTKSNPQPLSSFSLAEHFTDLH